LRWPDERCKEFTPLEQIRDVARDERSVAGLASAALPAGCGELVQGTLDGVPCLVTCPIDRYSIARVRVREDGRWVAPSDIPKSLAALRRALSSLGREATGLEVALVTDIPRGRGYGSSTADIGACLYALGEALDEPLAPAEVARLAVSVEPTDSTLFPGLTLFDHRAGSFAEALGQAPPLAVLVVDPGIEVDTLAYNRVDRREALRGLAAEHREAFGLLRQGIARGDIGAIGAAATLSARVHQHLLDNPLLDRVEGLARDLGAVGVCRAHSGSLIGILLNPEQADPLSFTQYVRQRIDAPVDVQWRRLVDGGVCRP